MNILKELGIDERTLILWTSDNGAVRRNPIQGSNAPLRGWGYDTSEGGQRMPCIVRCPGTVPAGVVRDDLTTMMDILPTVTQLAGTGPSEDRVIDGYNIMPILSNDPNAASPHDEQGFFYYYREQLQAVRSGPWKLYLPLVEKLGKMRNPSGRAKSIKPELYDVRNDIGETRQVSADHPDVVQRLLSLAEAARADLGDNGHEGAHPRSAGWVDDPRPQVLSSEQGR